MSLNPITNIDHTYLQGELTASYAEIVAVLGKPNRKNDGYKTDAEWAFEKDGVIFTLYNWKDGKNYLGKEGLPVREITEWHIGGKTPEAVEAVDALFPDCDEKNW